MGLFTNKNFIRFRHFRRVNDLIHRTKIHTLEWRFQSSDEEVEKQIRDFPDPVSLVHQLTYSVSAVDPSLSPHLSYKRMFGGRIVRAKLHLKWPANFCVVGQRTTMEDATRNAYLNACSMFKHLGLINKHGEIVKFKQSLLKAQESSFVLYNHKHRLKFDSWREIKDSGNTAWYSKLNISQPYVLCTESFGITQRHAERNASALAFMKMKIKGMLDSSNQILLPDVIRLPYPAEDDSIDWIPHYEFYVDASMTGYGAYLIPRHEDTEIRWIQEKFPDSVHSILKETGFQSTFVEFYALLATVFTWKKKMEGKQILGWCDNSAVQNLIKHGYPYKKRTYGSHILGKLYKVLHETCYSYKIELSVRHLNRQENTAADYLSRSKVTAFKHMVPNIREASSKSKKLEFFLPLVDSIPTHQKGLISKVCEDPIEMVAFETVLDKRKGDNHINDKSKKRFSHIDVDENDVKETLSNVKKMRMSLQKRAKQMKLDTRKRDVVSDDLNTLINDESHNEYLK